MIEVPILLVGFNRPDTIQIVFDKIKAVYPKKLYVAIDGPRANILGEFALCETVKSIVKNVTWECDVHYLFNEANRGAELTVSGAVSWALESEEFVVVLEDDIVASDSFFYFMQEMLIRYRNCEEIAMISGCNTTPINLPNNEDYLFGIYGHTWGWGTWKRAWQKFDLNISDFDEFLNDDFLSKITQSNTERKYIYNMIARMKQNGAGNNSWDYCWFYIRLKNELLSIIPRVHLTSNIGVVGFHAKGRTKFHFLSYDENFRVGKHPTEIKRNLEYDRFHFKKQINQHRSLFVRIIRRIGRFCK